MKNKEKYAKEIVEVACSVDSIAVTKEGERVVRCTNIACGECLFSPRNCVKEMREWVEQEYIEKPVISKRDRKFLEYICRTVKSIARDKNGTLCIFTGIVKKQEDMGVFISDSLYKNISGMFDIDFPMVKWADSEPWLIEDLKKLEVVEEYEKK